MMKEYATIDRLDRATAYQLISHVTVHEQRDEYGIPIQSIGIVGCISKKEARQSA